MKPLISLVIPVYNVEKYLPRCMDSVLAQTYENFEVVLIDDGSTDRSGRMCDEYAANDRRVRTLHKENGGLSDARNYGVQRANGGLISFIDSDDYVTEDYLEYLYCLMEKFSVDISCAGCRRIREGLNRTQVLGEKAGINEVVLDTKEALEQICYYSVGAWSRLYKRELLLSEPFPVGRLYEDLATTYRLIGACDFVAFSDKVIYCWMQHEGTITHGAIDEKQFDIFMCADEQLAYIQKNYPAAESAARKRCATAACDTLNRLFIYTDGENKEYYHKVRNYLKQHIKYVIKDRKVSPLFKAQCVVAMMGYRYSKFLWPVVRHLKIILGKE